MRYRGMDGLGFTSFALIVAAVFGALPQHAAAQPIAGPGQTSVRYIEAPSPLFADPAWDGAAYTSSPTASTNLGTYKIGEFNQGPLNLKLSIAPHASISEFSGGEQRSGGAEIRLGSNNEPGVERNHSWFLFAGAKGRAVTWDMGRTEFDVDDFVQLKRRATVGDFQAGLAYQLGPTQMSLGFLKRSYNDGVTKVKQNYGAISIAWRH
jgi:hypothetical protein